MREKIIDADSMISETLRKRAGLYRYVCRGTVSLWKHEPELVIESRGRDEVYRGGRYIEKIMGQDRFAFLFLRPKSGSTITVT